MSRRFPQRALELFDELVELSPAARSARLDALRTDEPALHAELLALLAADEDRGALDRHPASLLASDTAPADDESDTWLGQRIGPWRISGMVGRGGMGTVYRGERVDGEFQQHAAIKLIRLGLDHPELRRRFLRERQILARLQHPNIATLLDGGVADNGAPYFAMERVDGQPIDRWCDARQLGLRGRIRLFLQVCGAVQHAHQHLTVHRDLKPSNILVTGDGQAKLLDFGIAKLLEADTDGGVTLDRPFTPEYAAPEQLRGAPITTATDVYALGVVLFRLLADAHPFDVTARSAAQSPQAWTDRDPESLSRAAERITPAQAQARGLSPKALVAVLRGDLAAIAQRCLQPDPARRYASVEALGSDLKAWLDGHPVSASRGDRLYRLGKFVTRHRWGVAASGVALLAIGAALAAALWQADRARIEANKATAVSGFLVGIFKQNSVLHPDGAAARKVTAEELLKIGADRIRSSLREAPEARAELLGTMGELYAQLALQETAIALRREQLQTLRTLHHGPHPQVAQALQQLARSQIDHADYAGADKTLGEALRMFQALNDTQSLSHAVALISRSQILYRTQAQAPEALQTASEALRIIETHHPGTPEHVDALLQVGWVVDIQQGISAAEPYIRQALALAERPPLNANRFMLANCYWNMGDTERLLGRYTDAERTLRKSLQTYLDAAGPDHPFTQGARRELARLLGEVGKREEALTMIRDGLQRLERNVGKDDPGEVPYARLDYALLLLRRGELAAAAPQIERAVDAWREQGTVQMGFGQVFQARVQIAQGRYDEAGKVLAEAEPIVIKGFGETSRIHANVLNTRAQLQLARGDLAGARALYQRVLGWPAKPGETPAPFVTARLGLARTQLAAGDANGALAQARRAMQQIETSPYRVALPDSEATAQLLLGMALLRAGQAAQARPHLEAAVAQRKRLGAPDSPWIAEARLALAEAMGALGESGQARQLTAQAAAAQARHPQLGRHLRWPFVPAHAAGSRTQ